MGKWMKDHPEEAKKMRLKYYHSHKDSELKRIKQRVKDLTEWMRELKKSLCCEDCGESTWYCLDFHHLDPSKKDIALARVTRQGWGKSRILEEIAKCVVICSNCHRKRHFREKYPS
jgi:hypothetical protein